MKYTPKQYAQALFDTVQNTNPEQQDQVLDNFVKALTDNNDLRLVEDISEEFNKLELATKNKTLATVASARPLSHDSEKQIIKELNSYLNKNVELKKKIDESLIGGVVIQVDDTVIDTSVKKSLEQLKNNLGK